MARKKTTASKVRSMTGFGRARAACPIGDISVEIRGVNQRFLKLSIKLPGPLQFHEQEIRRAIKKTVRRGTVDVYVGLERNEHAVRSILDEKKVQSYVQQWKSLAKKLGVGGAISVDTLAGMPDFFSGRENLTDNRSVNAAVKKALAEALGMFDSMRQSEGVVLADDISKRLSALTRVVARAAKRAPRALKEAQVRVKDKLADMLNGIRSQNNWDSAGRELVIMADRMDISEEIVRAGSHLEQMRQVVTNGGETGKRLDFLSQELLREFNTMGSKSNDQTITALVVDAKVEVEKVREQVQNLE